jgi:dihydrofolate synthase/folylpolyglutamate synthase
MGNAAWPRPAARAARRVGDPHESLRCVHVAGTNGKGSTTTFVASILRAAGYRVGTYLSPYVFDLRERVQINGKMIPEADFARWVTTLRPHIEAVARDPELGETTEFELKTAVAFCFFAEQQVDFAAVEVGIGGRLDSTNVIPPPLAAVVTHIGLDHTSILGDTLAQIASEKAGIIKRETGACVTAVPPGEAFDVIAAKAKQENVPLVRVGPAGEAGLFAPGNRKAAPTAAFIFACPVLIYRTCGSHCAAVSGRQRGRGRRPPFTRCGNKARPRADAAFRHGLETAALPARFQIVDDGGDGARPALVLDGAHNEDGARVLRDALRATFPDRRFVFVVGSRNNHDPAPFLSLLAPLGGRVVATAPPFKPRPADEVADAARAQGLPAEVIEPAAEAIARTFAQRGRTRWSSSPARFTRSGKRRPACAAVVRRASVNAQSGRRKNKAIS